MPALRDRNRKRRKVKTKAPGGRVVEKRLPRKPGKPVCRECMGELHGIPRALPSVMRNLPKTAKRPERPYGGNLCSACMRRQLKLEVQLE